MEEIISEIRELREKSKMFHEESKKPFSSHRIAYYEGKSEAYGNAAESLSNLLTELLTELMLMLREAQK